MSVEVVVELPKDVFSVLDCTPEGFVSDMRLAAAVKWYELGWVSQGRAAEIAGISRQAFLESLARFQVSPFQVTPDELVQEFKSDESTLLSEQALAGDWNRSEEEQAWSHLQADRTGGGSSAPK